MRNRGKSNFRGVQYQLKAGSWNNPVTIFNIPFIMNSMLLLVIVAVTFISLYLAKSTFLPIPLIWYTSASLVTLVAYYLDKQAAFKNRRRTSEGTLHTLELIGGWPGALVGSRLFRHKTSKLSYQIVLWLIILSHVGLWIWLFSIGCGFRCNVFTIIHKLF